MLPTELIIIILLSLAVIGIGILLFRKSTQSNGLGRDVCRDLRYDEWCKFLNPHRRVVETKFNRIIQKIEASSEIELTWGAREMLIVPIVEIIERDGRVNWLEVESSITKVLLAAEPSATQIERQSDISDAKERSSLSIIKGYANKFCQIPPFCRRVERKSSE